MNGNVLINLSETQTCLHKEFVEAYEKVDIIRLNEITFEQNIIKEKINEIVNPQTLYAPIV